MQLPPDSEVVLQFGCGDGSHAEELCQRYPQMKFIGVENDVALRRQVQQKEFFVLENAATALAYLETSGELVHSWIIERLAWQDETLTQSCRRSLAKHLHPGAAMVWEVPNSQYWQHLLALVSGKTDGTVRHAVLNLVSELQTAGVSNIEVSAGTKDENDTEFTRCFSLLIPLIKALNISIEEGESFFRSDTLILRGWYQMPASEPVNITTVLGETKVCARVRVAEPHAFLSALPNVSCKTFTRTEEAILPTMGKKIWIWQRRLFPYDMMIRLQGQLMERRFLTIQEWDDDPLRWEEHFRQSRFIEFYSAHAIQASTQVLAEYLRQFNPEVKVFPNCIAKLPPLRFPTGPTVTIFFGALNRENDWKPIMPDLNSVLKRQGQRVRMIVVHDREFFDSVKSPNKEFYPFCDYSHYQNLLLQSDISLLPLLPSRFNRMKSDLKFLECAAWGTVALASPTVYADTMRSGETGLLYETEQQFREEFEQLIEDVEMRQRLARNAWKWVEKNRLLSLHYRERLIWYDSLFARYEELMEAIRKRVPELRKGIR